MPLVTTNVVTPGPVTPPPPVITGDQRTPPQITYIDPDGSTWALSDPDSGMIITSVSGIGSPPAALSGVPIPGGGSITNTYAPTKRQIVIGLQAYDDDSQAGLLDLIDRLAWALWTARAGVPAPGTLQVARPGGTVRAIDVLTTSGPEQADTASTQDGYQYSTNFAITFQSALDPLFQDTDPTGPIVFAAAPSGGVPPMPPVLLVPASTLGTTTVVNAGGGDAYPVWTIHGPGTATLTNVTTGRTFGLATALSSGEVVTVDTRPTLQSAVDGTGADRWGDLVKTSPRDLWTLVPGPNLLNVALTGAGSGSAVELLYHQRWLRA